jgi:hypothetical protein
MFDKEGKGSTALECTFRGALFLSQAGEWMVKEQLQLFRQLQTLERWIEEAAVVHFFWAWLGSRW